MVISVCVTSGSRRTSRAMRSAMSAVASSARALGRAHVDLELRLVVDGQEALLGSASRAGRTSRARRTQATTITQRCRITKREHAM